MPKYFDFNETHAPFEDLPMYYLRSKKGGLLGWIQYYPEWQEWVFEAEPECVFSHDCLADIEAKLKELNYQHKGAEHANS
jgi:hypothetical protein